MLSILISLVSGNRHQQTSANTKVSSPTDKMCTKNNNAKSGPCMGGGGTNNGIFMVPSAIYPIYSGANNILDVDLTQNILEVSRKIVATGELPKLQVVQKDGRWFTLNNAQLDLCRLLEKDGKCSKVKVDIVPMTSVPRVVRGMMLVPGDKVDAPTVVQPGSSDPSRTTTKGYERLDQSDGVEEQDHDHVTDSEAEETCSESSGFAESDSECDWSDDEPESSEIESSGTEDSQSSDDERECLL